LETNSPGFVYPNPATSITISLDSLVSPPTIGQPYSVAPSARPRPISDSCLLEILLGNPMDTIRPLGLMPFAAKSLTVDTIDFLPASERVMPGAMAGHCTNMHPVTVIP